MDYPLVSVIIPARNEEHYLPRCLDSVLANDYPQDCLEILVIDGRSTDRTREIVQEYAQRYPFIRLLENPKRTTPISLNIGLQAAQGEIIVRMDAHSTYAPDYIRQCVTLLQTTEAANVGGAQRAVGTDYLTRAIAIATTYPFGTGDAKFRYSEEEQWVDTVYLGAWHKATLVELGGFNEEWTGDQDYELNYRLRQAGGKILLSPKIRCEYYVRRSLKSLARQYYSYGFWRVKTLLAHPESLRWRHLVAPLFVLTLAGSLGLLPFFWQVGVLIPGLYAVAGLLASLDCARKRGWRYLPLLPVIFGVLHLSYGIGFCAGIIRLGRPRLSFGTLVRAFRPASEGRE